MVSLEHMLLVGTLLSLLLIRSHAQGPVITCFDTGLVNDCTPVVDNFCNSLDAVLIQPQNTVARCFHLNDNHCDLTAWYNSSGTVSQHLDATNCILSMNTVIANCPMGGSGYFAINQFIFTVDPNDGACRTSAFPL